MSKASLKKNKAQTAKDDAAPSVIWAIVAERLVKDADTGQPSAINIVEDIHVPTQLFKEAKAGLVVADNPLAMLFTVDWRWPHECTSDSATFQLLWIAPSGNGYEAVNDTQPGIVRPTKGNRKHIEIAIQGVPVEQEGIYHFELRLNGITRYRYPIRVRPQSIKAEASPSKKSASKRARSGRSKKSLESAV